MTSSRTFILATLGTALLLSSCLSDGQTMKAPTQAQLATVAAISPATTLAAAIDDGGDLSGAMSVTGPWTNGTAIDSRYSCDGTGVAPPLAWTNGPVGTKAYGIVLRDNDAPEFIHWVAVNIDPSTTSIGEGSLPNGTFLAINGSGKPLYAPPCPPKGSTHSYTLTVYALGTPIAVTPDSSAAHVIADMDASVLEVATTDFNYSR